MRHFQLILLFVFITQFGFAQSPREINDSELEKYKQEIQKESIKLQQELLKKDYLSDFDKQVSIDFQIDTFVIERLLSKRISIDYSTAGMTKATYDSEIEYDKLLNKYYQILIKKLNDSDKEILKQSQRNWIQYRNSERKLNNEIAKDEYSGGGTMQRIIVASGYFEITKKRVIELFGYLGRFNE
jgi:uncharacterized protein YecT (DUF1311 family)